MIAAGHQEWVERGEGESMGAEAVIASCGLA